MSAASMIAVHLNAPYGPIVSEQDVIESLRSGRFSAKSKIANDILAALFIETYPSLIFRCGREIGASLEAICELYQQSVRLTGLSCQEWEQAQK